MACARVRAINRLRAMLLEHFPALERSFEYSKNKAALKLLTHYSTPQGIRSIGVNRFTARLKARGCRGSAAVAKAVVDDAEAQATTLPSQAVGSMLVAKLAATTMAIDSDLAGIDAKIAEHLRRDQDGDVLLSMLGFGPILAATFLAQIGGSLDAFDDVGRLGRLGSVAGLTPVPRACGLISGNLHRPRRLARRLPRTCFLAALSSLKSSRASRAFYDRKRAEGTSHKRALIALARRRMNVIWAMLCDHAPYVEPAIALPTTA